jgi:signal transduction histidine kinase
VELRALEIATGLVFLAALWFRRRYPLGATAVGFGLAALVTIAKLLMGVSVAPLSSGVSLLLLPYSLFRWGSKREMVIGSLFISGAFVSSALSGEMQGLADAVGGAIVLMFPGALGATARFRAVAHHRDIEHARLKEREQLARELHDTVAHHMTAIAIQAQAGRAIATSRPEAASRTLEVIENEARSALGELRAMVGALRDEQAVFMPPSGATDIRRLARNSGEGPTVEVELVGDFTGLRPAVDAALFRIAQESITNAMRHAKRAHRVRVRVSAEAELVRLIVSDDGEAQARSDSGFGLIGMRERATLLGGRLEAGPGSHGGWQVEATLPRNGGER